jgi:hypothetical protein
LSGKSVFLSRTCQRPELFILHPSSLILNSLPSAILAVALASLASAVSRDAPHRSEIRPLGRIAGRRPKSCVYNSLQHIASRLRSDPPHEGVGAHLAAGPGDCHFLYVHISIQ